jgi:hypothetical protein
MLNKQCLQRSTSSKEHATHTPSNDTFKSSKKRFAPSGEITSSSSSLYILNHVSRARLLAEVFYRAGNQHGFSRQQHREFQCIDQYRLQAGRSIESKVQKSNQKVDGMVALLAGNDPWSGFLDMVHTGKQHHWWPF